MSCGKTFVSALGKIANNFHRATKRYRKPDAYRCHYCGGPDGGWQYKDHRR